jgi:hypothetical protein
MKAAKPPIALGLSWTLLLVLLVACLGMVGLIAFSSRGF